MRSVTTVLPKGRKKGKKKSGKNPDSRKETGKREGKKEKKIVCTFLYNREASLHINSVSPQANRGRKEKRKVALNIKNALLTLEPRRPPVALGHARKKKEKKKPVFIFSTSSIRNVHPGVNKPEGGEKKKKKKRSPTNPTFFNHRFLPVRHGTPGGGGRKPPLSSHGSPLGNKNLTWKLEGGKGKKRGEGPRSLYSSIGLALQEGGEKKNSFSDTRENILAARPTSHEAADNRKKKRKKKEERRGGGDFSNIAAISSPHQKVPSQGEKSLARPAREGERGRGKKKNLSLHLCDSSGRVCLSSPADKEPRKGEKEKKREKGLPVLHTFSLAALSEDAVIDLRPPVIGGEREKKENSLIMNLSASSLLS